MNYFELYGFPVLMKMDANELKARFKELSRRHHPDQYPRTEAVDSKELMLDSGELERAYQLFRNPDDLILYVLKLRKLVSKEETYELGPDFTATTLNLSNRLSELELSRDPEQLEELESKTKELIRKEYEDVAPIIEHYREDTASEKELLQVKDYYYRKKYLQRILDRIYQIRNIASHF